LALRVREESCISQSKSGRRQGTRGFWLKPFHFQFPHFLVIRLYRTLMHKTAVYRLLNGGIIHQRQQISEKVMLCSVTLPKCQSTAEDAVGLAILVQAAAVTGRAPFMVWRLCCTYSGLFAAKRFLCSFVHTFYRITG